MKITILFAFFLIMQISFAQNTFSKNIRYANKNTSNGLDCSDESFGNLLNLVMELKNVKEWYNIWNF